MPSHGSGLTEFSGLVQTFISELDRVVCLCGASRYGFSNFRSGSPAGTD